MAESNPSPPESADGLPDIEYQCPHCREHLILDGWKAGRELPCAYCGEIILVPARGTPKGTKPGPGAGKSPRPGRERKKPVADELPAEHVIKVDFRPAPEMRDESGSVPERKRSREERMFRQFKVASDSGSATEFFLREGEFSKDGMVAFACPACEDPIWIGTEDAGAKLTCSSCRAVVLAPVPAAGQPALVLDDKDSRRPADLPASRKIEPRLPREQRQDPIARLDAGDAGDPPNEVSPARPGRSHPGKRAPLRPIEPDPKSQDPGPAEGAPSGLAPGKSGVSDRKKSSRGHRTGTYQFEERDPLLALSEKVEAWDSNANRESSAPQNESSGRTILKMGAILLLLLLLGALYFTFNAAFPKPGAGRDARLAGFGKDDASENSVPPEELARLKTEALAVIKGFFEAQTAAGKAEFVRHQAETMPRLRRFYEYHGIPSAEYEVLDEVMYSRANQDQFFFFVTLVTDGVLERPMALERTPEGLKIDWESFEGYSEMPWKEYLEKQPSDPLEFRVMAELDNYYNYEFSDPKYYTCLKLSSLHSSEVCYGYVRNGSQDAQEIHRTLANSVKMGMGRKHMLLQLRFPLTNVGRKQVLIEKFINDNWLIR